MNQLNFQYAVKYPSSDRHTQHKQTLDDNFDLPFEYSVVGSAEESPKKKLKEKDVEVEDGVFQTPPKKEKIQREEEPLTPIGNIDETLFPSFWDIIYEKRGQRIIESICEKKYKNPENVREALYDIYERFLNVLFEKYHPRLKNIENNEMMALRDSYLKLLSKLDKEIVYLKELESLKQNAEKIINVEQEEPSLGELLTEEEKSFLHCNLTDSIQLSDYADIHTGLDRIELAMNHMNKVNKVQINREKELASKFYDEQIKEAEL